MQLIVRLSHTLCQTCRKTICHIFSQTFSSYLKPELTKYFVPFFEPYFKPYFQQYFLPYFEPYFQPYFQQYLQPYFDSYFEPYFWQFRYKCLMQDPRLCGRGRFCRFIFHAKAQRICQPVHQIPVIHDGLSILLMTFEY